MPYRRVAAIAAAVLLAAGAPAACGRSDGPEPALRAFYDGWAAGDLSRVAFVAPTAEPVPAAEVTEQIAALSGELAQQPPAATLGAVTESGDIATVEVTMDWPLGDVARWTYPTTVRLSRAAGGWRVIWEPKAVHPQLAVGDELAVRRVPTARGEILDGGGTPIVRLRPVTVVGIWPRYVTDIDALLDRLDAAFRSLGHDLDLSDVPDRVAAADEDHLVPVVPLRREQYEQIADEIGNLDGVQPQEEERYLAPSAPFARALLGTVDPVTREDMDRNPGVFAAGDLVGHGGLQERYDAHLRGTVGRSVVIARAAPDGDVNDIELHRTEPVPGADLRTTLDVDVQGAAEEALARTEKTAALVAIRISDGAVLAAANGPGAAPVDLALTAAVPPGSTFKMITAYGLLDTGAVTLDTRVACPGEHTVDGRPFRNDGGFELGEVPFRTAFARSCNTTFAALAPELGPDGLAAAGAALGIGGDWNLGPETFTGTVSTGGTPVERAAAAFGQGTTVVSPVAMAAATAAVARGAWLPPTLVSAPAAEAPPPAPVALDAPAVEAVREAMRGVVTDGTGQALADVPGDPVYAKTGTAEYVDGDPDRTHAWTVGFSGDLAFALFVEDGGSSSTAAVPLVERFLRDLR
jgi:cell division protein FtsI/penicillin-binding protein 2